MNRMQAIGALRYWASPGIVPTEVLDALERESVGDETPLETAVRIGNGGFAIPTPKPFDFEAVRMLADDLEIAAVIERRPGESHTDFEARGAAAMRARREMPR